MENNIEIKKKGMFSPALSYGVLIAVGLIILGLVIYIAGLYEYSWISYIGYVMLLAGIILGTINYRDEYAGGFISYGRALGFGTLVSFIAALVTGLFTYVFFQFIAPDALETLKELAEIRILRMDPNASDQQLDLARRFVNPLLMFLSSLFSYTFMGFIFSLVTAAFLKKKDPMEV